MENLLVLNRHKENIRIIAFDIIALTFIYFIPAISHLLNFPLYLADPMRIMLIISLAHTSKRNSYFIALSLPLFSLLISSHPSFYKMILISSELMLNIFLFYTFTEKIKNTFTALMLSIIISKTIYYSCKFLLINLSLLNAGLVSTPIYLQILTSIMLGIYFHRFWNKNEA